MLKRIAAALAMAISISGPASAMPRGLDHSHRHLWTALENQGVELFINPEEACDNGQVDLDGIYFYNKEYRTPVLVICQDNWDGVDGRETNWTANDLDTIRHEAFHYLQDCIDGNANFTLTPYYDGPGGAPGTNTYREIIQRLGVEYAVRIAEWYSTKMNADGHIIRLEHEAFLAARDVEAGNIGESINQFCRSTRVK